MRDVSKKITTFRVAKAQAKLLMSAEAVKVVKENTGPKKDIIPTAKAAAYLAAKNTHNVIPHCHPIPVDACTVECEFGEHEIAITVEVKAVYRTGVEMEALHAASVAALVVYDMLKPLDETIEITGISLLSKTGGKNDYKDTFNRQISASVIVCSDSVSAGKKTDSAGKAVNERLKQLGFEMREFAIIPDDAAEIRRLVEDACNQGDDLVVTVGGTGLGPSDVTPEALKGFFDREIPGIMETARSYGQDRMPWAMLSRGVAGIRNRTLVITLPGSTRGAEETLDALFPAVMHIFKVIEKSYRHDK